jgi:site-specific DNA-methyltransferase (adenine-specific)
MTDAAGAEHTPRGIVSVVSATPIEPLILQVEFSDGASGLVDLGQVARGPIFEALRDAALFNRVELDPDLGTVVWPNGADADPLVLRELLDQQSSAPSTPSNQPGDDKNPSATTLPFFGAIRGRQIHYGDNLPVLRERIPSESVDVVYLDPPFNSKRNYNVLYRTHTGEESPESVTAFEDFWIWDSRTEEHYRELTQDNSPLSRALQAFRSFLSQSDLMAYLVMMAPRLAELRRVLRPSGSIYLHCDQTASHYLKVLMDVVFGANAFLNNVVWLYGLGGSSKRYWPRKHDDLLWYAKKPGSHYFEPDMVPATSVRMAGQLKKAPDYWDIPTINNMAAERLGFPTQKPLALLERIVRSSSPQGGVVLDPFCGCGTTVEAAERLGRTWVGIDISYLAIDIVEKRLLRSFGPRIANQYTLFGKPASMEDAVQLYEQRELEFERWAVTLVEAEPVTARGTDLDGLIRFPMPDGESDGVAGVHVAANGSTPAAVSSIRSALDRSDASLGVVIPLRRSASLRRQAASAGTWTWPVTGRKFPRIQVISVEELLHGDRPSLPPPLMPYASRVS